MSRKEEYNSETSENPSSSKVEPTHYVGIGASAGGLEAIESFFMNMPHQSSLAFIVVQHLSPDYKSLMVELLSKKTEMKVLRAEDGMRVLSDHVYLIPPKNNLTIFHGKLILKEQPEGHGINLPIDIFFRSLAEDCAERAIAVVLSGTGSDGTRGIRAVKEFNGMVMVQDEKSAKFDGMPRAAVSTGLVDFVLPPSEMPARILAYAKHPYYTRKAYSDRVRGDENSLTRIFAELRERIGVDFTYYKPSTIIRRIERRMMVCHIENTDEYIRHLAAYPGEAMALYRELLIGVTSFFRDAEAMNAMMQEFMPQLFKQVEKKELRFWVAGCSTGEEAYTIAIMAKEVMEKLHLSCDVKIFATDLDRNAIMTAGTGIYPESVAADMNSRLVGKYFYKKGDNYQIARHIREMVVFAQHNLIKDPPFTNIDLVSCRNLLIYLQPVLQQKVMKMFNFSLNPQGILFLGNSETVGEMGEFFTPLHQKFKIYESRGKTISPGSELVSDSHRQRPYQRSSSLMPSPLALLRQDDAGRLMSRYMDVLSSHYVPLSVVVNEQLEIVYTLGDTEGFFKVPSGRAAYDISRMAAKDLSIPLTTGIQKVFRTGETLIYTNIRLKNFDETRTISMRLVPLPENKGQQSYVAVFIEVVESQATGEGHSGENTYDIHSDARQRIGDLEQELQFTKENLQATIEELETSNEELQATNEELLASNEELQSTNEELQSTNEELFTVNAEYQNKINELTELNNDVENLLTGSRIGTLLLDEDLEIRRYSPEISNVFHIMNTDIGRPISHLTHRIKDFDLEEAIETVVRSNKVFEKDVRVGKDRWYLMRILPYNIGPRTFSGIMITLVDLTRMRLAEKKLSESRHKGEEIIHHMPAGLFLYRMDEEGQLILEQSNPEAQRLTGVSMEQWAGKSFDEIWPRARATGLTKKLSDVVTTGTKYYVDDFDYGDERIRGTYRVQAFRLPGKYLAVSFEDITSKRKMEKELAESERKYRLLFETMAQGVVYQRADGQITSANPSAQQILGLTLEQMQGRTSMDPRWRAIREDGSELPGECHPSMVALRTGKPVKGFVMGVYNPAEERVRWIMVNANPEFHKGEQTPWQVYTTFEDITEKIKLGEK